MLNKAFTSIKIRGIGVHERLLDAVCFVSCLPTTKNPHVEIGLRKVVTELPLAVKRRKKLYWYKRDFHPFRFCPIEEKGSERWRPR